MKPRAQRTPASEVSRHLRETCARMKPGDRLPSRGELMRQYDASERAVLKALDELRLGGVIVSRNGSGTYVTEYAAKPPAPFVPAEPGNSGRKAGRNTVIALLHYQENDSEGGYETALSEMVRDFGFNLLTTYIEPDADPESLEPYAAQAAGFIVFHPSLTPVAGRLAQDGHAVVHIGRPGPGHPVEVPFICEDRQAGAYLALRHLAELGHTRILVQMNVPQTEPDGRRHAVGIGRGEREARRGHRELSIRYLEPGESRNLLAHLDLFREYFLAPDAPTAVIAWNDHEALKLLNLLSHIGLRVPGDVSVIGHDNILLGAQMFPPLTTVNGGIEQQLMYALESLDGSPDLPRTQSVLVIPSLIVRASTGPVPSNSRGAIKAAS